MFYVHVIGHYDDTFVGPFATSESADEYARHLDRNTFNAYVMSRQQFMDNVNEFGIVQVQAVLQ